MGRGNLVHDLCHTVQRRSFRVHLVWTELKLVFPLCRLYAPALELRKRFLEVNTSTIPLDSYRLCLPNIERSSSVVQMTLSVVFGRYSVALLNPPPSTPIPRIEPPGRSHRHHSFRCCPRTNPNHQIGASWEWV